MSQRIREFVAFAVGGLAVFAVYVAVFGHGGYYRNVVQATLFSEKTLRLALMGHYEDLNRFYWQTFSRNIAFYCLAFAGLGWTVRLWRSNSWEQNFFCCFTIVVLALMAIHREPWPYVFVLIIPFLGVYAGRLSERVVEALRSAPRILVLPGVLLLATVCIQAVVRNNEYARLRCFPQLKMVRAAESVLGPEDSYFDGVRMVGTRKYCGMVLEQRDLTTVVEQWETKGPSLLAALRDGRCKVIMYNYRLAKLPEQFREFLSNHYVLMDSNVFVSGCEVTSSPVEFELIWAGKYAALYNGNCDSITIDGKPADLDGAGVELAAGRHRVTYQGEGSFLLIPSEACEWMSVNPVERVVTPMFINVYDR